VFSFVFSLGARLVFAVFLHRRAQYCHAHLRQPRARSGSVSVPCVVLELSFARFVLPLSYFSIVSNGFMSTFYDAFFRILLLSFRYTFFCLYLAFSC
jgi:hypothetical protein